MVVRSVLSFSKEIQSSYWMHRIMHRLSSYQRIGFILKKIVQIDLTPI